MEQLAVDAWAGTKLTHGPRLIKQHQFCGLIGHFKCPLADTSQAAEAWVGLP